MVTLFWLSVCFQSFFNVGTLTAIPVLETKHPQRVAKAYSPNSEWRNRDLFFTGREAIAEFLKDKWSTELHYKLMREHWAFDEDGYMQRRDMSANDIPISASDRRL